MNLEASQLEGKTFEEKLRLWAKEVVAYCHPMAEKHDRVFYAFQSEPKEAPDVVILGLNPYGAGTYAGQKKDLEGKWKIPQGMTPDVFIQKNPWYEGEQTNWPILNTLKDTFSVNEEFCKRIFKNMVYMNLLYYNSLKFDGFKNDFQTDWSEVLNKNTEFTRFLIQHIIKPKKAVICLSIPDCFARLLSQEEKKKKVILSGYVHKAQIDGIKIYGIAHPAWLKINYGRQAEIGKCLLEDWDK
jgi:hypothetical protein